MLRGEHMKDKDKQKAIKRLKAFKNAKGTLSGMESVAGKFKLRTAITSEDIEDALDERYETKR